MHTASSVLLAFTLSVTTLISQNVVLTDWNTLSSLRSARDADVDPQGTLWVATSGGVFSYTPDTTVQYRNIDALQALDTRALLCVKNRNEVVVGGGDGSLDILIDGQRWVNVADIKRATKYPRRGITDLVAKGNSLFIATEFGIAVFDLATQLFVETIDRIGSLQEKTAVNALAISNDSLWAATDSGLAVVSLLEPTLRPPSVWTVYSTEAGLPRGSINEVVAGPDRLYVAADTVLYEFRNGAATRLLATTYPIHTLSVADGTLYYSSFSAVATLNGPLNIPWSRGTFLGHANLMINGVSTLVGFIDGKGVDLYDGTRITPVSINSPNSNQFARMAIDESDALWVATDVEPPNSGVGVNVYDGEQWLTINTESHPELGTNACYRVSSLTSGTVLIGTWGRGAVLAERQGATVVITPYSSSNSAFQGIASDASYCLAADAQSDRNGNVWVVNEQSASQLFVKIKSDGITEGYANCVDARNNLFRSMAIDGAGNKWAGSTGGSGLVVWNDKGTTDRTDDLCNAIRTSNTQLPDNVISVIRTDRTGALWVGTAKGVAVISSPTTVSNTSVPFVRRITALAALVVNDIFVDALNYKWVATNVGVFVLNEDGTEVLAEITKTTAPLLDENVRCVAVSSKTGRAYFGTSFGCTVAQTSSIEPSANYELSVRPQPFQLQRDAEVVIDGLAADSDVRILTAGGFLVAAFQTRGRQATWDGRDTQGREVPPGVYLIHATSATTKQSAVGKVAVRR